MASPIVAGAVALMKSINPDLKTMEVIDILQKTGLPLNEPQTPVGPMIQIDKALEMVRDRKINQNK